MLYSGEGNVEMMAMETGSLRVKIRLREGAENKILLKSSSL